MEITKQFRSKNKTDRSQDVTVKQFKVRIVLPVLFLLLNVFIGNAQEFEIIPFTGYQWGGSVDLIEGNGDVSFSNGQNIGIALSYNVLENSAVQFEYSRKSTDMVLHVDETVDRYQGVSTYEQWYQLGFIQQFPIRKLVPYAGISGGVARLSPKSNGIDIKVVFGMTGQIGVKYFLTDNIGIRLQSRLLVPVNWDSFIFHFDSRDDIEVKVSSDSKNLQSDVGIGLIFHFNQ
jgi:hypothetical protein